MDDDLKATLHLVATYAEQLTATIDEVLKKVEPQQEAPKPVRIVPRQQTSKQAEMLASEFVVARRHVWPTALELTDEVTLMAEAQDFLDVPGGTIALGQEFFSTVMQEEGPAPSDMSAYRDNMRVAAGYLKAGYERSAAIAAALEGREPIEGEWTAKNWARALSDLHHFGQWNAPGPLPGEEGCQVPAELLAQWEQGKVPNVEDYA